MSENHSWERRGSRSSHSSRGGPRFPPPPRVSRGWYPPPLRLFRNNYDVINHQKLTLRANCPHQSLPSQSTIPDFLAAIKSKVKKSFQKFQLPYWVHLADCCFDFDWAACTESAAVCDPRPASPSRRRYRHGTEQSFEEKESTTSFRKLSNELSFLPPILCWLSWQ